MNREEFVDKKFKAYQLIHYRNQRTGEDMEMFLVGIDFDNDLMFLVPIDSDSYEIDPVPMPIQFCEIAKQQPRLAHLKEKVETANGNTAS